MPRAVNNSLRIGFQIKGYGTGLRWSRLPFTYIVSSPPPFGFRLHRLATVILHFEWHLFADRWFASPRSFPLHSVDIHNLTLTFTFRKFKAFDFSCEIVEVTDTYFKTRQEIFLNVLLRRVSVTIVVENYKILHIMSVCL